MSVPRFNELMRPTLEVISDGVKRSGKSITTELAKRLKLTENDLNELSNGGTRTRFKSNADWARTYMRQAGLISCPERATYEITDLGKEVLNNGPKIIDIKFLEQFPAFQEFKKRHTNKEKNDPAQDVSFSDNNPEEAVDGIITQINNSLSEDLLSEIMKVNDYKFEKLVIDLLVKMGYGRRDNSIVTPASGDGGIDGILNEDKLGFSKIYVQAKHWDRDSVVGRPSLQQFRGAINGKTNKGLFVTTGRFSKDAVRYAEENQIILIDGEKLADLMIEHNFCVSTRKTYEIKFIDSDILSDYED